MSVIFIVYSQKNRREKDLLQISFWKGVETVEQSFKNLKFLRVDFLKDSPWNLFFSWHFSHHREGKNQFKIIIIIF